MSDEPRLRLERDGVVVSEYWYDQSTGETVVESESGETYRFANDGTLDTPALNTDDINNVHVAHSLDEFRTLLGEGHRVIQLAPGHYTYSSPIDPSQNPDVEVIDWSGAELTQADGANTDCFVHNGDNNVKYRMFCGTIRGNRANNTSGSGIIIPPNFDDLEYHAPRMFNIPTNGIHIDGGYNIDILNPFMRTFGNVGILFDGGNINDVRIDGGQILGGYDENPIGNHAIQIKNGTGIRINTKTQATTDHTIMIDWGRGIEITPGIEYAGPNGEYDGIHIDNTNGLTESILINPGKFYNVNYAVNVADTGGNQTNAVTVHQSRVTGNGQSPPYRFGGTKGHTYIGSVQPELDNGDWPGSKIVDLSPLTTYDGNLRNINGGFSLAERSTAPTKHIEGRLELADGTNWDPLGKGRPTYAVNDGSGFGYELEQSYLNEEGTQFVPASGYRAVGPSAGTGQRLIANAWIESGSAGAQVETRVHYDGTSQFVRIYNVGSADCTAGYEVRTRR